MGQVRVLVDETVSLVQQAIMRALDRHEQLGDWLGTWRDWSAQYAMWGDRCRATVRFEISMTGTSELIIADCLMVRPSAQERWAHIYLCVSAGEATPVYGFKVNQVAGETGHLTTHMVCVGSRDPHLVRTVAELEPLMFRVSDLASKAQTVSVPRCPKEDGIYVYAPWTPKMLVMIRSEGHVVIINDDRCELRYRSDLGAPEAFTIRFPLGGQPAVFSKCANGRTCPLQLSVSVALDVVEAAVRAHTHL